MESGPVRRTPTGLCGGEKSIGYDIKNNIYIIIIYINTKRNKERNIPFPLIV